MTHAQALGRRRAPPARRARLALRAVVFTAAVMAGTLGAGPAAALDLCGCDGHPQSLGAFDLADTSTWPPGTTRSCSRYSHDYYFIPLPPDGVLVFDSFVAAGAPSACYSTAPAIVFKRNGTNTPVTLLVAGDFRLEGSVDILLGGGNASNGSSAQAGHGGNPGDGGYRGGDGAFVDGNGASDGGAGLGPTGGDGGTGSPLAAGAGGVFAGNNDLRPLLGGAGGGGGASSGAGSCAGGGGGGGGGAILIAVNGTLRINGGSEIYVDGGNGGDPAAPCASAGGGGSGGAIRLVAGHFAGNGGLYARGGGGEGGAGVIRIEALDGVPDAFTTDPVARRPGAVAPLGNPLASRVAITAVDGQAVPQTLLGPTGGMDLIVSAPGPVSVQIQTTGVPAGTVVAVSAKPRVGGAPILADAVIEAADCDAAGQCTSLVELDLVTGAYFAEAQATFQVP